MEEKKYDLIVFTDNGLSLDVRVDPDEDTVWLTQTEMAELFDAEREGELNKGATCKEILQVQTEACRLVRRTQPIYNFDVIISVGYRVKSGRGILFRKWASSVLKQYLLKGYATEEKRLLAPSLAALTILIAESKPEEKESWWP